MRTGQKKKKLSAQHGEFFLKNEFFRLQNSVFGSLGDSEFADSLGLDLNRLACRRIPAHAGGTVFLEQFADTRNSEFS